MLKPKMISFLGEQNNLQRLIFDELYYSCLWYLCVYGYTAHGWMTGEKDLPLLICVCIYMLVTNACKDQKYINMEALSSVDDIMHF